MSRRYSGALLCAAAAATALAVAAFTDLGADRVVAREIAPPRHVGPAHAAPVAEGERIARIGAAILLGLEWSRR